MIQEITKEEFFKRLKEDFFSQEPNTLLEYRLPVLQFYITNFLSPSINKLKIIKNNSDTEFILVNLSFENLVKKFKNYDSKNKKTTS